MAYLNDFTLDVKHQEGFLGEKKEALIEAIGNRIDVMNSMIADRVRANLTGQVLNARSGKLLSTVDWTPSSLQGSDIVGSVYAGGELAPYGIYFEKGGLGPYLIEAVNGRALAFMMQGRQIFAQIVIHPAIPHLPWFQPAVDASTHDLMDDFQTSFDEILKGE